MMIGYIDIKGFTDTPIRVRLKNDSLQLMGMIDAHGQDIIGLTMRIKGIGVLRVENVTIDEEFVFICNFLDVLK